MTTPSGVIQMAQQLSVDSLRFNAFQGILFTSGTQIPASRILGRLLEKFGERFDGAPTVLPIPLEAPAEIPRIILQSADSCWTLEVALARINFRWVQMKDDQQLQPNEFQDHFIGFAEGLLRIEAMQIGRLAYALTRYVLSEAPASLVAERLCKNRITQVPNLENIEVHVHSRKKLENTFDVNEWNRFKSGVLNLPGTPSRKIDLVEQDINTLAENAPTSVFSVDDTKRFAEAASRELTQTLKSLLEN